MFHVSGIFSYMNCNRNNLNHAVLVVGYGNDKYGRNYWLIKNSYGQWWGENGYMRLSRDGRNACGISSFASYPLV